MSQNIFIPVAASQVFETSALGLQSVLQEQDSNTPCALLDKEVFVSRVRKLFRAGEGSSCKINKPKEKLEEKPTKKICIGTVSKEDSIPIICEDLHSIFCQFMADIDTETTASERLIQMIGVELASACSFSSRYSRFVVDIKDMDTRYIVSDDAIAAAYSCVMTIGWLYKLQRVEGVDAFIAELKIKANEFFGNHCLDIYPEISTPVLSSIIKPYMMVLVAGIGYGGVKNNNYFVNGLKHLFRNFAGVSLSIGSASSDAMQALSTYIQETKAARSVNARPVYKKRKFSEVSTVNVTF